MCFLQVQIYVNTLFNFLMNAVQVAKQQGEYVAKLLSKGKGKPGQPITGFKGFRYGHKGSLAYVGRDKAVMDVPQVGPIFGYTAGAALLSHISKHGKFCKRTELATEALCAWNEAFSEFDPHLMFTTCSCKSWWSQIQNEQD